MLTGHAMDILHRSRNYIRRTLMTISIARGVVVPTERNEPEDLTSEEGVRYQNRVKPKKIETNYQLKSKPVDRGGKLEMKGKSQIQRAERKPAFNKSTNKKENPMKQDKRRGSGQYNKPSGGKSNFNPPIKPYYSVDPTQVLITGSDNPNNVFYFNNVVLRLTEKARYASDTTNSISKDFYERQVVSWLTNQVYSKLNYSYEVDQVKLTNYFFHLFDALQALFCAESIAQGGDYDNSTLRETARLQFDGTIKYEVSELRKQISRMYCPPEIVKFFHWFYQVYLYEQNDYSVAIGNSYKNFRLTGDNINGANAFHAGTEDERNSFLTANSIKYYFDQLVLQENNQLAGIIKDTFPQWAIGELPKPNASLMANELFTDYWINSSVQMFDPTASTLAQAYTDGLPGFTTMNIFSKNGHANGMISALQDVFGSNYGGILYPYGFVNQGTAKVYTAPGGDLVNLYTTRWYYTRNATDQLICQDCRELEDAISAQTSRSFHRANLATTVTPYLRQPAGTTRGTEVSPDNTRPNIAEAMQFLWGVSK